VSVSVFEFVFVWGRGIACAASVTRFEHAIRTRWPLSNTNSNTLTRAAVQSGP